jgi:hypothetical protein
VSLSDLFAMNNGCLPPDFKGTNYGSISVVSAITGLYGTFAIFVWSMVSYYEPDTRDLFMLAHILIVCLVRYFPHLDDLVLGRAADRTVLVGLLNGYHSCSHQVSGESAYRGLSEQELPDENSRAFAYFHLVTSYLSLFQHEDPKGEGARGGIRRRR